MKPAGTLKATLWRWHAPIGAIFAIGFVWLGVTGILMTGRHVLEPAIGTVFEVEPRPEIGVLTPPAPNKNSVGNAEALRIAQDQMPDAKLAAWTPINTFSAHHQFAFSDGQKRVAVITISANGEILERYIPSEAPLASRVFDWAVPLHKGDFLPAPIRYGLYVVALALLLMAITGVSINRTKAGARKRKKRLSKVG